MFNIQEYQAEFNSYPKPLAQPLWVSDYESVIVHTRGTSSKKIIDTRRPNEPEEVKNYRISNRRKITQPIFNQAITNAQRIISNANVAVKYPDKLKEFLSGANFEKNSFTHFFQKKVLRRCFESAQGVLLWMPTEVGDQTKQVVPVPILIEPQQIVHYDENVFTFLSDEKSEIQVGKKTEKTGNIFYAVTKEEIWKRSQINKQGDYQWELHYAHNIGQVLALVLGGDETTGEVEVKFKSVPVVYQQSFLSPAVSLADECLAQFSDHQGIMVSSAFPLREVESMPCNAIGCVRGWISDGKKRTRCNKCQDGIIPLASSPYGVLVRPPSPNPLSNEPTSSQPMIRFISPDVSILEYSGKYWQELRAMVRESLNLLFIEEAQSGVAKEIDREDKLAFLDKIGQNLYLYLMHNSIYILHKLLFPSDEVPSIQITLPSSFVSKSESELIGELSTLRDKGAGGFLLGEVTREIVAKRYNGDPLLLKILDVLTIFDPLFIKTDEQKTAMLGVGAITEVAWQKSLWAYPTLLEYQRRTPEFMDMEISAIVEAITPLVDDKIEVADVI